MNNQDSRKHSCTKRGKIYSTINNVHYAEDTVLIAKAKAGLQELVNKVREASKLCHLSLKSIYVYPSISRKEDIPKCRFKVDGAELEQVKESSY